MRLYKFMVIVLALKLLCKLRARKVIDGTEAC